MLSLFFMLFIALAITSGVGFVIITLIQTSQTSLTIQANQIRMQNIATSLQSGLSIDAGKVLLPVRADFTARLPGLASFSSTTSNKEIIYCPALSSSASSDKMVNDLSEYSVANEEFSITHVSLADEDYISEGHADGLPAATFNRIQELGIVAYLISPQPNNEEALLCEDVTVASDNYSLIINGGSVTSVYSTTSDANGSIFVLSADSSVLSGYEHPYRVVKTLDDVSNFIEEYRLTDITLKLPSAVTFTTSQFDNFMDAGKYRTLRLEPIGSEAIITLDAEGAAISQDNLYLEVEGQLQLNNISIIGTNGLSGVFDVGISAMPAANITLDGSTIAGIITHGGRVYTMNNSIINPSVGAEILLTPVDNRGGQIQLLDNTFIDAEDADIVFKANAGDIYISSDVTAKVNSLTKLNSSENEGRVVIQSSVSPAVINVDRVGVSNGPEELEAQITKEYVSTICTGGAVSCQAVCSSGKTILSGGCSNTSGTAISGSYAVNDNTYQCNFASAPITSAPTATAVCDIPTN